MRRLRFAAELGTSGGTLGDLGSLETPRLLRHDAWELASFPVEAYPFVSSRNLIWKTLPGEHDASGSLFFQPVGMTMKEVGDTHTMPASSTWHFEPWRNDREEDAIVCVSGPGQFKLNPTDGDYIERALTNGKSFFRGGGLLGCTESNVMRDIGRLFGRWADEIESALAYTLSIITVGGDLVPQKVEAYPDAYAKLEALQIELLWAKAYFESTAQLIEYIEDGLSHGDARVDNELQANAGLGVGFLNASWDPFGTFGGRSGDAFGKIRDLVAYYEENKELMSSVAEPAIRSVKEYIIQAADPLIERLTPVVATMASAAGPAWGLVVQMVSFMVQETIDAWTEQGLEHAFRGDKVFSKAKIELYVHMNYRAMLQVRHMVDLLKRGDHPLQERVAAPPRAPSIFTMVTPPAPPPEAPKVAPRWVKPAIGVGVGVGVGSLVWYLVKRGVR